MFLFLGKITFYNCKKAPFKPKDKFTVSFVKEIISKNSCGKVDLKYFNTNLRRSFKS